MENNNLKGFCEKWRCCHISGKGIFYSFLTLLIVALTVYISIQSINILDSGDNNNENTITISAEGKVDAVPDVARVNFSVMAQGKTPKEVQQQVSEKMNKIIDFIKNQEVDAKDIKTLNISVNPQYYYSYDYPRIPCPLMSEVYPPSSFPISCPPKSPVIIGYEANQTLDVKIRKLNDVGDIIDGAVENGATQVGGINFSIDDPDELKAQARELAFKKAREKADSLAKIAGMKIKKVVTFSESDGYFPLYYGIMDAKGMGGGMETGTETSVEPGSQEVTVTMNVTFEIK
ncbi:MAG: SIMPL domain-containing protein [Patescibacteria group bacterium]